MMYNDGGVINGLILSVMLLLICTEKLQEEGGIDRQKQADADKGREYR